MVKFTDHGVWYVKNKPEMQMGGGDPEKDKRKTLSWGIMHAHSTGDDSALKIRFDALASHDITYVGIIQSARASGLEEFPMPYALTNCHNSLCAVGGTINEDDHVFGLSAARKYGGIFVPTNLSVIHTYAREALARCGGMVLGSDSHTRYGALGCMGVGEGGPELVKQLLRHTYDIASPKTTLVYLTGKPRRGIGPHDVALAIVAATFPGGYVNNRVLEFAGPGIKGLSIDYRCAIDVMTTETTCLSSVWETDDEVKSFYVNHGREKDYKRMAIPDGAYYDSLLEVDLSTVECMIALPFHPSKAHAINEFNKNAKDILHEVEMDAEKRFGKGVKLDLQSKFHGGKLHADQGAMSGCAGGLFDNIKEAAHILDGGSCGNGNFTLSVYPGSQPIYYDLSRQGILDKLMAAGAIIKPAYCGPCFGAGDIPANNGLSIRHATRNFPNREGSKPAQGQLSCVALMDSRSIAATALNQGAVTAATDIDYVPGGETYHYDASIYEKRVYDGYGKAKKDEKLIYGPNITDWPEMPKLSDNILVKFAAVIQDDVTTTDELIPSGETSSYRSNPKKMAEFTLSRRVPEYVPRAHEIASLEEERRNGKIPKEAVDALRKVVGNPEKTLKNTEIGSAIFAKRPGDGSAREQAASCQKVLGGLANVAYAYATKRYRSNLINWGIVPFVCDKGKEFSYPVGSWLFVGGVKDAIATGKERICGKVITEDGVEDIELGIQALTEDEKKILLSGCLINYYRN